VLTKDRTSRHGFQAADRRSELTLENANHVGTGSQLRTGVGGRGSEDAGRKTGGRSTKWKSRPSMDDMWISGN